MTRAAAAALVLIVGLTACNDEVARRSPGAALVEREVFLMGTRARLATYQDSRNAGLATLDRALSILEQTEAELSSWRTDSLIASVNREPVGRWTTLSALTCRMFAEVERVTADSGGTFDPTMGALVDAWGLRERGRLPTPGELAAARARTGWPLVVFDAATCRLRRTAEVSIETDGFGKGEAIDRIVAADLAGPWLIDLGGQIGVSGLPPGESGWRVSIAHPSRRDQPLLDILLTEGSLSTSGGSERDLIVGGQRVGHILDPRSGRPAPFDGSVTVWHGRALTADMLSTALYVMGPEEGMRWAAARDVAACFLVPSAGDGVQRLTTPAFDRLFGPAEVPTRVR